VNILAHRAGPPLMPHDSLQTNCSATIRACCSGESVGGKLFSMLTITGGVSLAAVAYTGAGGGVIPYRAGIDAL